MRPDEERMLLTGLVGDVLLTVCYVERGRRKRIISARKATKREQDEYNQRERVRRKRVPAPRPIEYGMTPEMWARLEGHDR